MPTVICHSSEISCAMDSVCMKLVTYVTVMTKDPFRLSFLSNKRLESDGSMMRVVLGVANL